MRRDYASGARQGAQPAQQRAQGVRAWLRGAGRRLLGLAGAADSAHGEAAADDEEAADVVQF